MHLSYYGTGFAIASLATTVTAQCNPLTQNSCSPIPGLASSSYSIDFTTQKSLPSEWILADASNVTFTSQGLQFNFNKRKDAPYIWTNFYVAYGTIDVVLQVAYGTGIITSSVMFSDDADEIDWEFSGSNFGAGTSTGKAQTNVFAKGITGNYDRGTQQDLSPPPQSSFHTYTINWTPDRIDWIIDGATKYSTTNNGQTTGNYQFPQTPSRLHIGIWDAGDPDTAPGTRNWAGGYTDYTQLPYFATVKSVKISTPYPCKSWQYPAGFSGSWQDVKCTNQTITSTSSASSTSSAATPVSTAATYTVVAGDNGWGIADKLGCSFDQLSAANPGVNWDALIPGQTLRNPNAVGSASASSSSTTPSNTTSISSGSSSSGTATTSKSVSNIIVPVTASGSSTAFSSNSSVSGTSAGTSQSSPVSSTSTGPDPASTTKMTATATATATITASNRRSTSSSSTVATTKSSVTQNTSKFSPSATVSASSGNGFMTWAGNYGGSKSNNVKNVGGSGWNFWKRTEGKHRKVEDGPFGRFGGVHHHA